MTNLLEQHKEEESPAFFDNNLIESEQIGSHLFGNKTNSSDLLPSMR